MTPHLHPIRNEADYRAALKRLDELFEFAQPGTPAGDETEVLLILVKYYEDEHYPIAPPDLISGNKAFAFLADEEDLYSADDVVKRYDEGKD